ncbi:MAG TPA: GGDEF domain-containing protein [Vicinamibacterales bacterium]|nr:GGDEF domain-containing protein [Vicinamibacterales bacterium]
MAAFGAAVICALLLLQYAHRRKPFILVWAAGWLVLAPMSLAIAEPYTSRLAGDFAIGLSQLLRIVSGVLFLWSGDLYRQTRFVRASRWRWAAGVAVWFVVAPMLFGPPAVVSPGYALSAAVLAGAGAMYAAVLIERRMIGAGLVAFVLFGVAVSNLASVFASARVSGTADFSFDIFTLNAVLYIFGAVGIHLLVFEDMTYELRATNRRLEAAQRELVQAAITDPLTTCHNRRFFEQVGDRELQRHARFELPLSLLFVDVNRFKAINDTLGHEAGDHVLVYVARFLKRHIREADYVFRWGGDEFLVLITCTGREAQKKAAQLKAAFDAAPEAVDLPPGIGLSVGWTEVPAGTTDLLPLIREADERMYRDKGTRTR